MKGPRDLTRLMRLKQTQGTPLQTIIEHRLVCKSDWQIFCGAQYRQAEGRWVKKRDGRMVYKGPAPRHGG